MPITTTVGQGGETYRYLPAPASTTGRTSLPTIRRSWQVPGAPIVTHRTPPGTRNVPGYSPFGGYDMTAPECLKEAS